MRLRTGVAILVVAAVLAGGCARTDPALRAKLITMARNPIPDEEYRIAPPDSLTINVKDYADYSGPVMVRPDGKITVTAVGDVQVQGMTTLEAAESIRQELLKELEAPIVTVTLNSANSKAVYVLGEVARQGAQRYFGDMNVIDAIASAGGYTQNANIRVVSVTRASLDHSEMFRINLRKLILDGAAEQNMVLKEGDIVYVPPTGLAKVGYGMNQLFFPFRAVVGGLATYGSAKNAFDNE